MADEVNDVFKDVDAGTGMVEFMASVDGETKVKDLDDNQKADINNDLKNAVNAPSQPTITATKPHWQPLHQTPMIQVVDAQPW